MKKNPKILLNSFIVKLLLQTAKEAKLDILKELLARFTEGNFVGISSVHKLMEEIKEK